MIKISKTVSEVQNITNNINIQEISPNRIDLKINDNTTVDYPLSANSVELMPKIDEYNGYIKLTTKVNSNFVKGDIVYISALSGDTGVEYTEETYVMDNIIEVSGCSDWYYHPYISGYEILDLDEKKNQIIINRKYDSKFDNKKLINHYVTKIYVDNQDITSGIIDGVVYKNINMNISGTTDIDITLSQTIILSGISNFVDFNDKFDKNYSSLNTSSDYSNYISKNNEKFGYNIIKNLKISGSTIDNGYYYNCEIYDSIINYGYYYNCIINGGIVNNGEFLESTIQVDVDWKYGIWNDGVFNPLEWNDGVWNIGIFENKTWKKGVFNGGTFKDSYWENGYFNGGLFTNSDWSGGTFTKSIFIESNWSGGTFNGLSILNSNWYNGNFYSGEIVSSNWYNGNFYNGNISNNSHWYDGKFYNGNFNTSNWHDGIFYNGIIEDSIWSGGTFNNGIMLKTNWYNGIFNDGLINGLNSGLTYSTNPPENYSYVWYDGIFNGGKMDNMYWIKGTFNNGIVDSSVMVTVDWNDGIFNGNIIGPYAYDLTLDTYSLLDGDKLIVNWKNGTFNNGKFGLRNEDMEGKKMCANWSGGTFFYGDFYNFTGTTDSGDTCGGFYDGVFLNGNFYGVFYNGSFVSGNFVRPPAIWAGYKLKPYFMVVINIKPTQTY